MANTKASLTQQNTNTYPSNTSGSITANAVKSFNNNFINAVATLGDTNVFTEPQTFGDVVQVNSDVIANNVYAGNIPYLSGSNVFTGPSNTFSGSVNIQTASIQFLTVDTIVSSSAIFSSGSNILGDAANDIQTLWGTVNLPTGPLKVTGSVSSTGGFTGSLQGTASWANNATNAITASHSLIATSASYATNAELLDGKDSSIFATTGSNTFTDSQLIVNGKTFSIQGASQTRTFSTQSITSNGASASFEVVGGTVSSSLTLRANDTSVEGVIRLEGIGTGSKVQISGSTSVSGSLTATSLTGSLSGSATNAFTASSADDFTVRGELYANELNTINSTVNASTRSAIINGGDNTITSASLSSIFNSTTSQILGYGINDNFESNNNTIIGGKTSVISGSNQSTILGGSVRMNNVTSSVALGRVLPYTASANYTLYTQNIQSSGSVIVTGSINITDGITGSLQGTASYAVQALSASWAPGAGGMNLGANVFTGSQTLSSSTIPASLIFNVSGALPSFVTESNGANTGYGNILFNQRTNAALSGSSIISGSGNIIFEAGASTTAAKGLNGNNNIGQAILYSGSIPTATSNYAQTAMVSSGSRNTLSLNVVLGQPTLNNNNNVSASFSTNVVVSPVQVNTAFSSSGLNASSTVQNGFFGTTLVDIAGSGSTARAFQNNLFGGNANTASLTTATGSSNQSGSLYNTFVYGVGLIVSGTQIPTQTLHGGAFVGRYNETGSGLADNTVVFAVGAGTSATRKTALIVSASGDTLIRYGGQVSGSFRGQVSALTVASNTASLNLSTNNFFTLQLVSGSNVFINPSNILPGQTVNLLVNTTGSGTVSFPSTVKQASGSAYVPTTTTGVDVITFIAFDSTNLYISNVKNLI